MEIRFKKGRLGEGEVGEKVLVVEHLPQKGLVV